MRLGDDFTGFDTSHLNTELIAVCTFHLHRDTPEFSAWKALRRHHIVWPRTVMQLQQDDRPIFVADPVMTTLHDPEVAFRRACIAGQDDDSDYLILDTALVDELAANAGVPATRRRGGYRFGQGQTTQANARFRDTCDLFACLRAGVPVPALALEERAIAIAADVIALREGGASVAARQAAVAGGMSMHRGNMAEAVAMRDPAVRTRRVRGLSSRPDAVSRAKRYIAEHPGRMPGLGEIARAAYCSPFHLTRLFRQHTGMSLHRYVMTWKARVGYAQLPAYEGRLARLADKLGYADLAHMSRQFRRMFGVGPRELLAGRR